MAADEKYKTSDGGSEPSGGNGKSLFNSELMQRLGKLGRSTLRNQLTTAAELERLQESAPPAAAAEAAESTLSADRTDQSAGRGAAPATRGSLTVGFHNPAPRLTALADLCPGCVQPVVDVGPFWLIDRPIVQVAPEYAQVQRDYARALFGGGMRATPETVHENVRPIIELPPQGIAYLDIETCGMAGSAVFLVGLLVWNEQGLVLRQLLARDYSEERAVLAALWTMMADCQVLVSFNGRTFDLPFLLERSAVAGAEPLVPAHHVDLLHESRRRWKGVLPNCKLQTVERFICGRARSGDIPGSEIPGAYHAFVRTGDAREMRQVLYHNAIDLLTLAEIVIHIVENRDAEWL